MSNGEVHRHVLDADSGPLVEIVVLHRFRWLGHVLHMPAHRLTFRVLFARVWEDWRRRRRRGRDDHAITWRRV